MGEKEDAVFEFDAEVNEYQATKPVHNPGGSDKADTFKVTIVSKPNTKIGLASAKGRVVLSATDDRITSMFPPGTYAIRIFKKPASKPEPKSKTTQKGLEEKKNDPGTL